MSAWSGRAEVEAWTCARGRMRGLGSWFSPREVDLLRSRDIESSWRVSATGDDPDPDEEGEALALEGDVDGRGTVRAWLCEGEWPLRTGALWARVASTC